MGTISPAYYRTGIAELSLQNTAAAEAAFRKSIELSESHYAPAQTGLSLALYVEIQFVEAEAAARAGLQLDSTDATGHYALASVLVATGYLLLAQIHQHQNNPAAVVADVDVYLKLDPDRPRRAKVNTIRAETQNSLAQQATGSTLAKANP